MKIAWRQMIANKTIIIIAATTKDTRHSLWDPGLIPIHRLETISHAILGIRALIPFLLQPSWHLQVCPLLLLHAHSSNARFGCIAQFLLGMVKYQGERGDSLLRYRSMAAIMYARHTTCQDTTMMVDIGNSKFMGFIFITKTFIIGHLCLWFNMRIIVSKSQSQLGGQVIDAKILGIPTPPCTRSSFRTEPFESDVFLGRPFQNNGCCYIQ